MTLSKEERARWRNIWCILRSLEWHDLIELSIVDWGKFKHDPHGFLLRTDDRRADAIWRAVEKRLK